MNSRPLQVSLRNKDFTQIPEFSPFAPWCLKALAELDVQEPEGLPKGITPEAAAETCTPLLGMH